MRHQHVPEHTIVSRDHGRGPRPSHAHSSHKEPNRGIEEMLDQRVVDGVVGPGDIPPGTLDGDALVPGSLSVAPFADTIRPVAIVTVLPTLPDVAFPVGAVVFLTSDSKLYRNSAGAWIKSTDGADLVADTVTAGAIAAGAVGASEIATGAIHIGHMMGSPSNLVPNPSYEFLGSAPINTDAPSPLPPGWDLIPTGMQISNTAAHSGANALRIVSAAGQIVGRSSFFPIIAARKYAVSFWVRGNAGNGASSVRLNVRFYNAAFAQLSNTLVLSATPGTSTTYVRVEATITADAGASFATVVPYTAASGTPGDIEYVDDIEMYVADYDVNAANGGVSITPTGMTLDGSLATITFKDQFGATTLNQYGFSDAWRRFIASGVYNGDFAAGSASNIAISEFSGGDSDADYTASISPNLPYWVVSATDPDVALTVVTDAAAESGKALRFNATGAGTTTVYQDVPIASGAQYLLRVQLRADWTATNITYQSVSRWRNATHADISGGGAGGMTWSADQLTYQTFEFYIGAAPASARYLRLPFAFSFTGTGSVWLGGVSLIPVASQGTAFPLNPVANQKFFRTDHQMEFYWNAATSQWESAALHQIAVQPQTPSMAVTTTDVHRVAIPTLSGMSDVVIERAEVTYQVQGGGTALGGSHNWSGRAKGFDLNSAETNLGLAMSINSGASSVWRRVSAAGGLGNVQTYMGIQFTWTKTGTPGNLVCLNVMLAFRYVAT